MPLRPVAALLALTFANGAVAQAPRAAAALTLLQMEIAVPATLPASQRAAAADVFLRDTRRIRVCGDAIRLAERYKREKRFTGRLTIRNGIPLGTLPPIIQNELRSRPTGHASRVYTGPNALRVLIACTAPVEPRGIDRTI